MRAPNLCFRLFFPLQIDAINSRILRIETTNNRKTMNFRSPIPPSICFLLFLLCHSGNCAEGETNVDEKTKEEKVKEDNSSMSETNESESVANGVEGENVGIGSSARKGIETNEDSEDEKTDQLKRIPTDNSHPLRSERNSLGLEDEGTEMGKSPSKEELGEEERRESGLGKNVNSDEEKKGGFGRNSMGMEHRENEEGGEESESERKSDYSEIDSEAEESDNEGRMGEENGIERNGKMQKSERNEQENIPEGAMYRNGGGKAIDGDKTQIGPIGYRGEGGKFLHQESIQTEGQTSPGENRQNRGRTHLKRGGRKLPQTKEGGPASTGRSRSPATDHGSGTESGSDSESKKKGAKLTTQKKGRDPSPAAPKGQHDESKYDELMHQMAEKDINELAAHHKKGKQTIEQNKILEHALKEIGEIHHEKSKSTNAEDGKMEEEWEELRNAVILMLKAEERIKKEKEHLQKNKGKGTTPPEKKDEYEISLEKIIIRPKVFKKVQKKNKPAAVERPLAIKAIVNLVKGKYKKGKMTGITVKNKETIKKYLELRKKLEEFEKLKKHSGNGKPSEEETKKAANDLAELKKIYENEMAKMLKKFEKLKAHAHARQSHSHSNDPQLPKDHPPKPNTHLHDPQNSKDNPMKTDPHKPNAKNVHG